ncbi:hypothetical protein E2C01_054247 [Portunus trituberculatus]|uniref:Uncharacterized protein n=1 Tax=Portunus trituberculatus TaxID=210409 RepID=A0A5B7GT85_PORTR|nr:hypothetical protein [Portunus trituberculatus]
MCRLTPAQPQPTPYQPVCRERCTPRSASQCLQGEASESFQSVVGEQRSLGGGDLELWRRREAARPAVCLLQPLLSRLPINTLSSILPFKSLYLTNCSFSHSLLYSSLADVTIWHSADNGLITSRPPRYFLPHHPSLSTLHTAIRSHTASCTAASLPRSPLLPGTDLVTAAKTVNIAHYHEDFGGHHKDQVKHVLYELG